MPRESPALARAQRAVFGPVNKVAGSPIRTMLLKFQGSKSMTDFHDWRVNPITMLMIEVLRELALDPSQAAHLKQTPEIEYGVTQGIVLSSQLLNDPSSIYADVFSDPTPEDEDRIPEPTYSVPPDGPDGSE